MNKRKTKVTLAVVLALIVGCVFSFSVIGAADTAAKPSKAAKAAADWATKYANNNDYNFGKSPAANHTGCAFCKVKKDGKTITTNRLKKEQAVKDQEGKWTAKWDKTYCSNTFLFSAYAHGGNVKSMLDACKKGNNGAWGKNWIKYGFKDKGKIAYSKLLKGDIICNDHSMTMYLGDNKYITMRQGFGKESIQVSKLTKDKYKKICKFVLRY